MATVYAWKIDKDKYAYLYDETKKEPGYFGEEITGQTLDDLRVRIINTFGGCSEYQRTIYESWYNAMIKKIQNTPGYEWVTFGDYSKYFCGYGSCDSLIGPMGLPSMVDSTTTTMNVVDDNGDKIKDVPVKFSVTRSVNVYDEYTRAELLKEKGNAWVTQHENDFKIYRNELPGDDGKVYFDGLGRLTYSADNTDAWPYVKNATTEKYYIKRAITEDENQYHVGIDLTWPNISRYVIVDGEEAQKISAGTVPATQYKATPGAVYLVATNKRGRTNDYVEYVVAQKKNAAGTTEYYWEKLGEHELLLTDYYTRTENDDINRAQTESLTGEITTKYNIMKDALSATTQRVYNDMTTMRTELDEEDTRISNDLIAKDTEMRDALSATTQRIDTDINGVRNDLASANTRVTNEVKTLNTTITNRYNDLEGELKELSADTVAEIIMRDESITSRVANLSAGTISKIEQTAKSIRSEVADFSANTMSSIEQTASDITLMVKDFSANTMSSIQETAESINGTVAKLSGNTVSEFANVRIEAGKIENTVANLSAGTEAQFTITAGNIKSAVDDLSGRTTTLISQTASGITSTVAQLSGATVSRFSTVEQNISGVTISVANLSGNTHSRFEATDTAITQAVQNLSANTMGYIETKADAVNVRVTQLSGNTVTKFSSIDTELTGITAKVVNLSGGTEARFKITEGKIETDVSDLSGRTASLVKQTATGITETIAQLSGGTMGRFTTVEKNISGVTISVANLSGNTHSRFVATDSAITQAVQNLSANTMGEIHTTATGITQTVTQLSGATVSRFSSLSTTIDGIDGRVTNLSAGTESRLLIMDKKIDMSVSSGETRASIVAKINDVGSSEVLINANAIKISGDTGIAGKLSAYEGTIGNVNLKDGSIKTSNNKFVVDKNGNMTATTATLTGTVNATGGTIGGLTIGQDNIKSSNNKFIVDKNGNMTATTATLTGTVNATGGTIGGISIANGGLEATNFKLDSSGMATLKGANFEGNINLKNNNYLKFYDSSNQETCSIASNTFAPASTSQEIALNDGGESWPAASYDTQTQVKYSNIAAFTINSPEDKVTIPKLTGNLTLGAGVATDHEIGLELGLFVWNEATQAYEGYTDTSGRGYFVAGTLSSYSINMSWTGLTNVSGLELGTYYLMANATYSNTGGKQITLEYEFDSPAKLILIPKTQSLNTQIGSNGMQISLGSGWFFQSIKYGDTPCLQMLGKDSSGSSIYGIKVLPSGLYINAGTGWKKVGVNGTTLTATTPGSGYPEL